MAGRVPELTFTPYRFEIGDTIEVVDKQNGQLDAMEAFAEAFNAVMETVDADVEEVRAAQEDVVAKGEAAVEDIHQAHEDRKAQIGEYADQRYAEHEAYADQRYTELSQYADERYAEHETYADQRYTGLSQYADQRRAEIGQDRADFAEYADQRQAEIDQVYNQADQRATDADNSASLAHQYMDSAQKTVTDGASLSDFAPFRWWEISADSTLQSGGRYLIEADAGPLHLTLDPTPSKDAVIQISWQRGTSVGTTVTAEVHSIEGDPQLSVDVDVPSLSLIFDGIQWLVR